MYKDREWLAEQYVEKELSDAEIAEKCGVARRTICDWRNKFGIEGRDIGEAYKIRYSKKPVPLFQNDDGYEMWIDSSLREKTGLERVRVHRLAAVAWHGLEAVKGKDVHHESNIPWDNRENNLKLLSRSEHTKLHGV